MNDFNSMKIVCAAMLQSWRQVGFNSPIRQTELEPTKSGIAGLLACAFGYPKGDARIRELENQFELYLNLQESGSLARKADHIKKTDETDSKDEDNRINDIDFFDFSVPDILNDYHTITASGMITAEGKPVKTSIVTNREYIVGYRYVLYLFAEKPLLNAIKCALENPAWDYYLGSKCCIPSEPVYQGFAKIEQSELEDNYVYQHIRD